MTTPAWNESLRWPRRWWAAFGDLGRTLEVCRFSVVSLLMGAAVLFQTQSQDLLRAVADHLPHRSARIAELVAAAIVWGHTNWYYARVMLYFRFGPEEATARQRQLAAWIPRLLGGVAIFLFGAACWRAGAPLWGPARRKLHLLGAGMMGASILFYLFVRYRRDLVRLWRPGTRSAAEASFRQPTLPRSTRFYLAAWLAWALVLLAAFWMRPVQVAPWFGPVALLLLTASLWVPLGSLSVYAGKRLQLPVTTFVLVVAVVFSATMDNHTVRTIGAAGANQPPRAEPPELVEAFTSWMRPLAGPPPAAPAAPGAGPAKPRIFFVAAEGGGVRAAYWTAKILSGLTDENRTFPDRLFAVSSVSGGSLGAVVFDALLAERQAGHLRQSAQLQDQAKGVLGEDFLSPVLAALLFPDAFVHFIPFSAPLTSADRARALEGAWEASWQAHVGSDRLSRGFAALFREGTRLPHLLLNSTCVETGQRWAVSDLRLAHEVGDVNDAGDLFADDLPLSTAAHLSARFPYVSPGGRVPGPAPACSHLVDGGYFENSGTATLLDLLEALPDTTPGGPAGYVPVVISINNDPERDCPASSSGLLSELTIPVDTLLDTRGARGRAAELGLMKYTTGETEVQQRLAGCDDSHGDDAHGYYIEFALPRDCTAAPQRHDPSTRRARTVPVPLGWMLSSAAQGEMDKQWDSDACRHARRTITTLLASP
jgi:hypothetical protein